MPAEVKIMGYDYTNDLHKHVAIDPVTKALLVKDLTAITDHGALTGLADDDHAHYYNAARHTAAIHNTLSIDHGSLSGRTDDDHAQYLHLNKAAQTVQQNLLVAAGITIDGIDISAHVANADAHHVKYTNAEALAAAEAEATFAHVGSVSHTGATLKAGTQSEGRVSAYAHDADTNYTAGDKVYGNAPFREEMTNTPTSITLSDSGETEHWKDQNEVAEAITIYGFCFVIESDGTGDAFSIRSLKYVTVGN